MSVNDHLANERTLLAWIRTAITLIALAIAVLKISVDQGEIRIRIATGRSMSDPSLMIGMLMLTGCCLLLMLSYFNYLKTRKQILNNSYTPSIYSPAVVVIGIIILVLTIVYTEY